MLMSNQLPRGNQRVLSAVLKADMFTCANKSVVDGSREEMFVGCEKGLVSR